MRVLIILAKIPVGKVRSTPCETKVMLKIENKDLEHTQYDNHLQNARHDAGRAGEFHDGVADSIVLVNARALFAQVYCRPIGFASP
jgi:hypothetical protein